MDYRALTHQQLHEKMLTTSARERELTVQMIALIEEADRRKLFLSYGFNSLYDYLTLGLKYSSGAAMRRIQSARLVREIPQVKEQIRDGSLSLSHIARAQQFFKDEEKHQHALPLEKKKEILKDLEGQSTREAERTLISLSSQPLPQVTFAQTGKPTIRPISNELSKMSFVVNQEFLDQLEEVKGLLAHSMPEASLPEIMAKVMEISLAVLRKKRFKLKNASEEPATPQNEAKQRTASSPPPPEVSAPSAVSPPSSADGATNRAGTQQPFRPAIPAATLRQVWARDQGQCTVILPHAGKPCGSKHQLEVDHKIPWAVSRDHSIENLRLACRKCNQLHAAEWFGARGSPTFAAGGH